MRLRPTFLIACLCIWFLSSCANNAQPNSPRPAAAPSDDKASYRPSNKDLANMLRTPWQGEMLTMQISYPQSWDNWYVCLARVEQAKSKAGAPVPDCVRLVVETNYNTTEAPAEFVMPTWTLWRGYQVGWNYAPAALGSNVVLWAPQKWSLGHDHKAFYLPVGNPTASPTDRNLPGSLELISACRRAGDPNAKDKADAAALTSRKAVAVMYVCNEWGAYNDPGPAGYRKVSANDKKMLLAVRDDESLPVYARLLASRLMGMCEPAYKEAHEHYQWVRAWFDRPRTLERWTWDQLLNNLSMHWVGPPGTYENYRTTIWPLVSKLLLDPAIDDAELYAILDWLNSSGRSTNLQTTLMVIGFLYDQAHSQPTADRAALYITQASRLFSDTFRNWPPPNSDEIARISARMAQLRMHIGEYSSAVTLALPKLGNKSAKEKKAFESMFTYCRTPYIVGQSIDGFGGRLRQPGHYPMKDGKLALSQLLQAAGFHKVKADDEKMSAVVSRWRPDKTEQQIVVDIDDLTAGKAPDVNLQLDDVVLVRPTRDLAPPHK